MNECKTCRWYIPVRMLTEEEAQRVYNGEFIEVRACRAIWANKCVYEPYDTERGATNELPPRDV